MSLSLDRDGGVACVSCKVYRSGGATLDQCVVCEHFVCTDCRTYHRQGPMYGYHCKKCHERAASKGK